VAKPLRHATVLFLLGLVAMASMLGGESAQPLGFGGPAEEEWLLRARTELPSDTELIDAPVAVADARLRPPAQATRTLAGMAQFAGQPSGVSTVEPKPLIVSHTVQKGETLWDIARRYGIDVDTIVAANDLLDIDRLQIGQELTILTVRGALHTVQRGESLWDIARKYEASMEEIVSVNGLADPSRLKVGQQLVIPGAQAQAIALRREQLVSSSGQLLRNFDWPVQGRISSRYGTRWGRMHYGLDIAVPSGTPVRASAAGKVTYAGSMGSYGLLVIIDHGNRVETRYAHNSRIVVKVGQRVKRGDIIAYSGNTGNSTGPHLHFEIRYRGTAVNPENYLKR